MTQKEFSELGSWQCPVSFQEGFNKAKELYPFSFEDMVEFLDFISGSFSFGNILGKWYLHEDTSKEFTHKELINIWQEQRIQTVYYK